ncbi:MAG: hypothetical protein ACK4GL_12640 [Flavobacteriales bacterium]
MTPYINGTRHSWGSIKLNILGRLVTGFTAISYEDSQEKENVYGGSNYPVSRGKGKYEAKASITLLKYEVDALQAALPPGKGLQDIPAFDIPVVYIPEGQDGLVTNVIRNAEFMSNKREWKSGDAFTEVELELIVSHIDWNV